MNKKVSIYFTNYFPLGSRTLQNFYFLIKCEITDTCHKSPIVYGGKPNYIIGKTFFWKIDLNHLQRQIVCQLLFENDNSIQKSDKLIAQSRFTPNKVQKQQQRQIIFYQESKKIGILTFMISQQQSIIKVKKSQNIFLHSILNTQSSYQSQTETNKQQIQLTYSQDFQDQRYQINQTPYHSNQCSFIKLDTYCQMTNNQIFDNLDESQIPERYCFQKDQSFILDSSFQYKKQNELSSLQKWLKKLKDVDFKQNNVIKNVIEVKPVIPQKYLDSNQNYDAKLNFKYIKIKENYHKSFIIKTLSLNFIDKQKRIEQEPLFECKFSVSNGNQRSGIHDSFDQIKFQNLIAWVPSDQNFQFKIFLKDGKDIKNCKEISGIFIKDQYFKEEQIPIFDRDEKVFGTLGYVANKIQNASVQCLPPIEQNPFEVTHQNKEFSNVGFSPDKNQSLKYKIRQRKLNNNIVVRREIQKDFKIKKYSYDEQQEKQMALYSLNSPTRTKVNYRNMEGSKLQIKQNSEFSSQNQFQRSNTQKLPYFQLQTSNENKQLTNRSQQSPNRYKIQNLRQSFLNSPKFSEKDLSPSKSSQKHKNQQHYLLRSTNLTDLQEEQSEQQKSYLNGDTFNLSLNKFSSPVRKMSLFESNRKINKQSIISSKNKEHQLQSKSQFIIKINSVTVISYQTLSPQEEQSGKFLILKSQKGQTFITEALFSNHLNLSWKNKSYQFTSSQIQISLYQRTGYSSQCQNKHNFNVNIKFSDLMKAIKQNFFRQQIWVNGQAIGIIVLLYDILMEKKSLFRKDQQNLTEIYNKSTIQKRNKKYNKSDMAKKSSTRNQEKSTIKIQSQFINRKRAKTLQNNNNSTFLPSIERSLSRRPKMYEGGKNIKIGRAERFLSFNMGEAFGQS